jgi:S1-C subfamily serine protease
MYDNNKTEESETTDIELERTDTQSSDVQSSDAQPPDAPPPYSQQPYYAQPPYTQPPYAQSPYVQQPYTEQPYMYAAAGEGYRHSPYSEYAKVQFGQQTDGKKTKKDKTPRERKSIPGFSRKNLALLISIIVVACLASGIGGGLIVANMTQGDTQIAAPENSNNPGIQDNVSPSITIEPRDDITTAEAVAKKVLSSVVGIEASGVLEGGYYGPGGQEFTGVGTGMILDTNGYILTNSHVVMDGVIETIIVHLSNGEEVQGELIWYDTGLDLAIIKIETAGLIPVELGDSDNVTIGSIAIAIGNPLGLEFSGSVTQGVVSGLDRTITVASGLDGSPLTMHDLIQVDAAINSGNSGGPLLNSRGQVIGVNTAKARAEGMGFAIPINTALPVVEKVLKEGGFERVFMGVSAAPVEAIRNNYPNVEIMADRGAVIVDISPGSPAENAGLKVKDVIIEVDGTEITGSDSLIKVLLGYASGDTITVKFDRDGEIMETEVTLLSQSELDLAAQEENPFRNPQRDNTDR